MNFFNLRSIGVSVMEVQLVQIPHFFTKIHVFGDICAELRHYKTGKIAFVRPFPIIKI